MAMSVKKRLEISKFNNFDANSNLVKADKFYNYLPTEQLNNSMGVKVATFPKMENDLTEEPLNFAGAGITSIEGVAYFKQYFPNSGVSTHRLLIYGNDKKVYINEMFCKDFNLFWLYNLTFNYAPITLSFKKNDTDAIILTDKEQMKVWKTNYSPSTIENVPVITSMCMNEGELFCTIQEPAFKIWHTSDLDAEKVGELNNVSGYISLEDDLGYARKVVTFDENVYVFRDYGISKISKYQKGFNVSQVYLSNTMIYSSTVSVCGNMLFFMTNEGIYSFNGVKVNRVNERISKMLSGNNEKAVGSSLGNKYYLAVRLNFEDEKKVLCEKGSCVNNAVIVFDIADNSYEIIRGIDVKSLLPIRTECFEKMLCTFNTLHNDKLGEFVSVAECFEKNLPKFWLSKNLFEDYSLKIITKLTVLADKDVKFKIIYDGKEMSVTTYRTGLNEFCFKISGKEIKLEISSSAKSSIVKNVVLDYYE